MKKILLIVAFILVGTSSCYGAVSDDAYLRRDVFDAKMDAFMSEIRLMNEQMRREMAEMRSELERKIDNVDRKIDNVKTELHQEIQSVKSELHNEIQVLSSKVDLLDERTESTKTVVYWGFALLGLILASAVVVPPLAEFFKGLWKKEPSVTLEDVERLISLRLEALSKTVS